MDSEKEHKKPKLNIVKVGGQIIEDQQMINSLMERFAKMDGYKILVHGGGKRATEIERKLGIESKLFKGRRITSKESLDVVVMVYGGLVNKTIIAGLQANNCNAIGLCGADGSTILAHKRPVGEVDFGFVGDIIKVNPALITQLIKNNITPVFCALTHDGAGQLLNTNADTIASELAIGLSNTFEVSLLYCFEKKGVLKNIEEADSIIRKIDRESYRLLLEQRIIGEGMLPKLHNSFNALEAGVHRVYIGDISMLEKDTKEFTIITL
ncbi:MAG: acetylglutamate kinase [Flavobacteriaceae bacterium]